MLEIIVGLIYLIGVIIYIAVLTYEILIEWFQENEELVQSDVNNMAFSLKDNLATGNYAYVQGVFNVSTNTIEKGRKLQANKVDAQVEAVHTKQPLVIYN